MELEDIPSYPDVDIEELFSLQANFCLVFKNATRLKILSFLGEGEKTVSELSEETGASLSSVSQHLRLMKDRRIVTSRVKGQKHFYRITHKNFLLGPRIVRQGIIEVYGLSRTKNQG